MSFDTSLRSNLFVLDYESAKKIIYAPLQGQAFFCGAKEADEVKQFVKNGIQPHDKVLCNHLKKIEEICVSEPKDTPAIDTKDRLVIILSQMCNMACSYCFAQESRSSLSLKLDVLKSAIDYVFSQEGSVKVFTFIGGGEPFVTWKPLQSSIEYISAKSADTGIEYSIRLITNGTLIDYDKASFLSNYHVSVSLSFEILPDVQNEQRPLYLNNQASFESICKGIDILREFNIPFGFRSTITEVNVNRMPEMVTFALEHFPDVSRLHFEPVTTPGLSEQYYHSYVKGFIEAFSIGDARNIFVTNSFINSYFKIKPRFCQGELCLTPTGDLVTCHRHSSDDDPLFKSLSLGKVDTKSAKIDRERLFAVTEIWNGKYEACRDCMAKWHCSGKCASIRKSLTYEENQTHCGFIRELLTQFLSYNLKH